jgi:predicted aspartyl protease
MDIKEKYKTCLLNFESYPKYVDLPYIRVVLHNPQTGKTDSISHEFLVDTGASISIINNKFANFLKDTKRHDRLEIQFGKGSKHFYDVFEVILIIQGNEISSLVAFVPECPFLLLGHYSFIERNSYTLFTSSIKQTRMLRN